MEKAYCENCDKFVDYKTVEKNTYHIIHVKIYYYNRFVVLCNECGKEASLNDIIDENIWRLEEAYFKENPKNMN